MRNLPRNYSKIVSELVHHIGAFNTIEMSVVSCIVPVYNVASFLGRGIDSVLAQSFKDFELILVDDGSSDGSGAICDDYSQRDSRVKVIHQENAGVSAARNAGLRAAKGDWVTFVDSDDLVLDCFLQSLVDAVSADNRIDLAYCGYAIVENSTSIKSYKSGAYIGQEQIHDLLSKTNLLYRCSPWAKLFRRSIIEDNGLQFDEKLSISEDRLFLYKYLVHVKGIAVTSQVGYLYGSFSPTSLKHKRVPSEMLAYRQQMMTEAAHGVINRFEMGQGDAYLIARHLTLNMFELLRCVYQESGVSPKTVECQKGLFEKLCQSKLYEENLQNNQRWQQQLKNNRLISLMVNRQFSRMNKRLRFDDVNLSIRRLAYRMLKQRWKPVSMGSFDNSITLINEVK